MRSVGKIALAFGALVLLSLLSECHAQDVDNFQHFITNKQTLLELSSVGTAFALDGLSTQAKFGWPANLRSTPAFKVEINPIFKLSQSRAFTGGAIAGGFAAYTFADYKLRHHKRIRFVANMATLAVESWAIRGNYRLAGWARNSWHACMSDPQFTSCPR